MNSLLRRAFFTLCALALLSGPLAQGQQLGRGYDWEIGIQTEPLKDYLSYSGSAFRPIIRAAVSYKETQREKTTRYEDLWYRGCDPVGCKRYNRYQIHSGDGVAIRVTHKNKTADTPENCAAANAVVRLLLDAYMNGNSVISVIVPASSFNSIANSLERQHFYPAGPVQVDTPDFSAIVLHLQSDPPGSQLTLNYAGRTTD